MALSVRGGAVSTSRLEAAARECGLDLARHQMRELRLRQRVRVVARLQRVMRGGIAVVRGTRMIAAEVRGALVRRGGVHRRQGVHHPAGIDGDEPGVLAVGDHDEQLAVMGHGNPLHAAAIGASAR